MKWNRNKYQRSMLRLCLQLQHTWTSIIRSVVNMETGRRKKGKVIKLAPTNRQIRLAWHRAGRFGVVLDSRPNDISWPMGADSWLIDKQDGMDEDSASLNRRTHANLLVCRLVWSWFHKNVKCEQNKHQGLQENLIFVPIPQHRFVSSGGQYKTCHH